MEEFYSGVSYYGIGKIIKEYANFPRFLPFPVGIQHGWSKLPIVHDARYDAPENWYWSEDLATKYRNEFEGLNIRVVGSPFLYLLQNLQYVESSKKKGSIVFPCHSSKFIEIKCNFDDYADMLESLPEEYKPITICMYYIDLDNGLDDPFRRKGFEIIKNGDSIFDIEFLKNFIKNTHNKKYAFSNQMTSALLFASTMGLKSFFYGPKFDTDSSKEPSFKDLNIDYTQHHRKWEEICLHYFEFPTCDIQSQKEFVSIEMGENYFLSSTEMNIILWQAVFNKHYLNKMFHYFKECLILNIPIVYVMYTKCRNILNTTYNK
jgi:hypothetical protein